MDPIEYIKNRSHDLVECVERDLETGRINEQEWYRRFAAITTPSYLASDNPRGQSGNTGDDARWTIARGLIADAIHRNGSLLDVGCASGYLMECMQRWCAEKGVSIEPYGLEISPELADLARRRLPHWADRIFDGNAIDWIPPKRFDFVRTGLYVPRRRRRNLVEHLLKHVVSTSPDYSRARKHRE